MPTSCTDGCRVAWVRNKDGTQIMLGSVRQTIKLNSAVILPGVTNAEDEALLLAAANHGWRPKWMTMDGCQVSWVIGEGVDHTIGSVRKFNPTNPDQVEAANKLPLKNMQELGQMIKEACQCDPFDL